MLRQLFKFSSRAQREQLTGLYEAGKNLVVKGQLLEAKQKFLKVIEIDPYCEGARYRIVEIDQALNKQNQSVLISEKKPTSGSTPRL